jgi:threonine dehydratase
VGLQVPKTDGKAFAKFLRALGYPYVEETDNPVYRMFLQS